MKAVFDTCILIDYLDGHEEALVELKRYSTMCISRITWMEVMCRALDTPSESEVREFLSTFETIEVDEEVAEKAVRIRYDDGIKLPDAIIYATAQMIESIFITRNTRDFDAEKPDIRIPYTF